MIKQENTIGVASILIGLSKFVYATYDYMVSPELDLPNLLVCFMLPKWNYYMSDWFTSFTLLFAGVLVFLRPKWSYFLYHLFFVGFSFYWLWNLPYGLSFISVSNAVMFILALIGIWTFRKQVFLQNFKVQKLYSWYMYLLFWLINIVLIEVPQLLSNSIFDFDMNARLKKILKTTFQITLIIAESYFLWWLSQESGVDNFISLLAIIASGVLQLIYVLMRFWGDDLKEYYFNSKLNWEGFFQDFS